jgi:hypothetical protein
MQMCQTHLAGISEREGELSRGLSVGNTDGWIDEQAELDTREEERLTENTPMCVLLFR